MIFHRHAAHLHRQKNPSTEPVTDVELNTNLKHETFLLRDAQGFAAFITANPLGAPTQGSERANLIVNPPSKILELINQKGTQQVNVTETKKERNYQHSLNTDTSQTSLLKTIGTKTISVERIKRKQPKVRYYFYFFNTLLIIRSFILLYQINDKMQGKNLNFLQLF